jgi:hypothetical protein
MHWWFLIYFYQATYNFRFIIYSVISFCLLWPPSASLICIIASSGYSVRQLIRITDGWLYFQCHRSRYIACAQEGTNCGSESTPLLCSPSAYAHNCIWRDDFCHSGYLIMVIYTSICWFYLTSLSCFTSSILVMFHIKHLCPVLYQYSSSSSSSWRSASVSWGTTLRSAASDHAPRSQKGGCLHWWHHVHCLCYWLFSAESAVNFIEPNNWNKAYKASLQQWSCNDAWLSLAILLNSHIKPRDRV